MRGAWFRRLKPKREFYPCDDCAILTAPDGAPDEWYTVSDAVWDQAAAQPWTILCIGCLERRLGRQLSRHDFLAAALNDPSYGWHSSRLVDRLTRG